MTVNIEDITRIIGLVLGRKKVSALDRLMEDLGAESADILNIIVALEDKYRISIDEGKVPSLRTGEDLYHLVQSLAE
jgi:acyl carrier protein